jgi:hypothetical protein
MAHDHPHGHPHGHSHSHSRGHGAEHAHPPHDHNHDHAGGHLHSHMDAGDAAAELQVLAAQFIDSFREARDKAAWLRVAGVPLEIPDGHGGPPLKLVDVQLATEWQVGTASPSFGTRELSYLPYPGSMVTERTNLGFVYVSLQEKRIVDLRDFLAARGAA